MTSLNYRGHAFDIAIHEAVKTDKKATFRGHKVNISSPAKPTVELPEDMQFFGRRPLAQWVQRGGKLVRQWNV